MYPFVFAPLAISIRFPPREACQQVEEDGRLELFVVTVVVADMVEQGSVREASAVVRNRPTREASASTRSAAHVTKGSWLQPPPRSGALWVAIVDRRG